MARQRNGPPLSFGELRRRIHQHRGEVTPQFLSLYAGFPRLVAVLRVLQVMPNIWMAV